MKRKRQRDGFTLIELLVVIAILAILGTATILVINPGELIRRAHDETRLNDLATIKRVLGLAYVELDHEKDFGAKNLVYTSLPDTDNEMPEDCDEYNLPGLPTDWHYVCRLQNKFRAVDGTGWIPVNLTKLSVSSPISKLPTDPVNSTDLYYTYVKGSFEVSALLQSNKYREQNKSTNGVIATNSGEHKLLEITPKRRIMESSKFTWYR